MTIADSPTATPPIAPRTALETARHYLARGWQPIPIPTRSKRPIMKGWETLQLNPETAPSISTANP